MWKLIATGSQLKKKLGKKKQNQILKKNAQAWREQVSRGNHGKGGSLRKKVIPGVTEHGKFKEIRGGKQKGNKTSSTLTLHIGTSKDPICMEVRGVSGKQIIMIKRFQRSIITKQTGNAQYWKRKLRFQSQEVTKIHNKVTSKGSSIHEEEQEKKLRSTKASSKTSAHHKRNSQGSKKCRKSSIHQPKNSIDIKQNSEKCQGDHQVMFNTEVKNKQKTIQCFTGHSSVSEKKGQNRGGITTTISASTTNEKGGSRKSNPN